MIISYYTEIRDRKRMKDIQLKQNKYSYFKGQNAYKQINVVFKQTDVKQS